MSKIAALSPMLLGSLALGAGASLLQSSGMRATQKRNDAAKTAWLDYQNRNKARLEASETAGRERAQTAAGENLRMQSQESREGIIDAEAARLEENYGAGLPDIARDTVASSQEAGRSEVFDTEMARSLAKATSEARDRIKALAKSSAYGGGTQFGMGQTLNDTYGDAATEIGFTNDQRQGDIRTLQRHQTVQPEVFEYQQSPLVSIMQAGSAILGGMDPSSLSGLFGAGGGAMASSIRPKARPTGFSFLPTQSTQSAFVPSYPMGAGGGLPGPR
jgi:hypothetical protein